MERIGFIGMGIMGRPMATNLVSAGYEVTVFNRTAEKMRPVVNAGARPAESPADAARKSDIVITMVSDSPDVVDVVLGEEGAITGLRPGQVLIDMSTISPEVTRQISSRLEETGVEMLDAPVSGGEKGAIEGTLSIMVGGKEEVFQRCLPVFQVLGSRVTHMGPIGSGQATKMCNQIVCGLNILAVSEGLMMGAKQGLNLGKLIEVIANGAAGSWMVSNLGPKMIERDFRPGFTVDLQQKDLRIALDAAASLYTSLPGTALVNQLFASVQAGGAGTEGTQALIKALERLNGIQVAAE